MAHKLRQGYERVSYDDDFGEEEELEATRSILDDDESAHTLVGASQDDLTLRGCKAVDKEALAERHLRPERKYFLKLLILSVLGILFLVLVIVPVWVFCSYSAPASKISDLSAHLDSNDSMVSDNAVTLLHEQGWTTFDTASSKPFQAQRRPMRMLRSQQDMSDVCADQWIAAGVLCDSIAKGNGSTLVDSEIDLVWTWVAENEHWSAWRKRLAANPKWGLAMKSVRRAVGRVTGLSDKQFRSHDQLRYSQRSALAALPNVRKVHLIANDLPMCEAADTSCSNIGSGRVGQIPLWLDPQALNAINEKYKLQYHWNLFRADDEDAAVWRASTLPVFDSLAIESQLSNVDSVAETFLYMNDDLYILRPITSADISTPLLGPVFRIQKDLLVHGEAPGTSTFSAGGEWPGMTYANWLLDQRFGERARSYLVHESKTVSSYLLDEIASVWAEELKATAGVRFRGRGTELNTLFLATYYVIERHREALLWSFFMAKMDTGGEGNYSAQDRQDILATLGARTGQAEFNVTRPDRDSLTGQHANELLQHAGLSAPNQTSYSFSSVNGYALASLNHGPASWPDFDASRDVVHHPSIVCSMNVTTCFGAADFGFADYKGDDSSMNLFKRMSFDHPECGDCAILALLGKSGKKGLEAFLPAASAQSAQASNETSPKAAPSMLGDLEKEWRNTDFSVSSVVKNGWTKRDYAIRLIQRYSYVIGETSSRFYSIRTPLPMLRDLKYLEKSLEEADGPTFVALNDDIARARDVPTIDANLGLWHEKMWPEKMQYEL